jgi:hypothetical protein
MLMNGRKNVILHVGDDGNPPAPGIENRFTGVGRPDDIARHNKPLNNRQQRLLDKLPRFDSRTTVKKSDVSMIDLAALTAKENAEFAMFTRGPERLVIRGDMWHVNIGTSEAAELNTRGYKWSGHTHIGSNLVVSIGDKKVLRQFDQKYSVIYNSFGKHQTFHYL